MVVECEECEFLKSRECPVNFGRYDGSDEYEVREICEAVQSLVFGRKRILAGKGSFCELRTAVTRSILEEERLEGSREEEEVVDEG